MKGVIFDIQRFCINDGPGIRSTVFLKGCMLNCLWCHNPESKKLSAQLSYHEEKCIQCRRCEEVCSNGVHIFEHGVHHVDFNKCLQCGRCIKECPSKALSIVGKKVDVKQVVDELEKDKNFYNTSGGGITISGGEPMMQAPFAIEIAKEAKKRGLHVTVETSGYGKTEDYIELAKYVDVFLFDFKACNAQLHKKLIGVDNALIIKNRKTLEELQKDIILRCPLILGYNISEEHFKGIAEVYAESKYIRSVEILPYHAMGESKAMDIGVTYPMDEVDTMSDDDVDAILQKLKGLGVENIKRG